MPGLNLAIDTEYMEQLRRELRHTRGGLSKVLERSLNRAVRGVRTDASKEIRMEVTVKDKYVKRSFRLHKASAKRGILSASIVSTGQAIPLIGYQARQRKGGVSVKVNRQGGSHLIPHAFIASMKSGHRGVFQRKVRSRDSFSQMRGSESRDDAQYAAMPREYRLPIKELYGPAVPSIFRRDDVLARLKGRAGDRLETELRRQAKYEIEKSGIKVEGI